MKKRVKILAILGTYRKGGITDQAVDALLGSARKNGAETSKIYLMDKHIEFCTNCRTCTQNEGRKPGACVIKDGMAGILEEISRADAIVLASPANFGTVTAVMKKFIERLICFAYWPWGKPAPKLRDQRKRKKAVLIGSSAAPAAVFRVSSKMVGLLEQAAQILGAKTTGVVFMGLAARKQHQALGWLARQKARRLGKKLALHAG